MDLSVSLVARDSSQGLGPGFGLNGLPRPAPPKATKRPKKAVLFFEVEILDAKTREKLCFLDKVEPQATIAEIKNLFTKTRHPQERSCRASGRTTSPSCCVSVPCLGATPGPVGAHLAVCHDTLLSLQTHSGTPPASPSAWTPDPPPLSWLPAPSLACICHSFHYIKRLLETLFVHRFSHGTMPLRNIFKNCTYYWGFAAWMAYYINHPLYTPPTYGAQQVKLALAIFVICQLGNFSIHMALRDLRPAGSKTRKIPYPTKNPFTWLFLLVSCPNYTYEVGSWIGFAIMTQCLPVALFSLVGFTQMTIWAKGKHRSYLKEFRDYPPLRMPIIPFLL
ncbi:hypothetical protein K5549_004147 [Capra hircus]|nr:hypothetical protein K5549_004147 [Capra hircus]